MPDEPSSLASRVNSLFVDQGLSPDERERLAELDAPVAREVMFEWLERLLRGEAELP
ncbi:MAG: hypothetical protein ACLQK4_10885 [Acidimicrobiales bacterium]|jgi:hypothetical protein